MFQNPETILTILMDNMDLVPGVCYHCCLIKIHGVYQSLIKGQFNLNSWVVAELK